MASHQTDRRVCRHSHQTCRHSHQTDRRVCRHSHQTDRRVCRHCHQTDRRVCRHCHQTDSKDLHLVPHNKAGTEVRQQNMSSWPPDRQQEPPIGPTQQGRQQGPPFGSTQQGRNWLTSPQNSERFGGNSQCLPSLGFRYYLSDKLLTVQKILTVPKKKVGCLPSLGFRYYLSEHLSLYGDFESHER